MKASSSITISHITDGLTTYYEYAKNSSNTTAPSSGATWSATVPTSEAGKFIWRREGYALPGENPTTWGNVVCLTGATGTKGDPGTAGTSGLNSAVVFLYKRGATAPTKPSTNATYTFATGILTGHNNSWTQAIPATNGQPLWVIQATASATAPTATATILSTAWGTQIKLVEDGTKGDPGSAGVNGLNQATIYLYQRKASVPAVTDIADPITYKFSDGTITGSLGSWSKSVPNGNNPLYVTIAVAIGNGATDTIPRSEWTTPTLMAKDGAKGDPGVGILAVMAEYISHTSNLSIDGLDEEKDWTPEPPERGSGEYIWMRNVIYYDNETSTITEPVCVTGERGPSGKRGEIGAYVASNTLYIKGFGEDGELTEALGFLYTSNARYLVVASEYLLTEGGVGYIGLSGNEVLVLKIDPQIGYVKWVDYNTGVEKFPDLIFGKIDKKTSGITDVSLITPSITSEFVKLHFMAIMANAVDGTDTTTEEGRNRVEVWADALGVSQFFESIAVLEAFIHALTVNRLNIESNDLKVRVSPDGFVDGGVAYPLFAITDGAGRPILQIDGKNKNLLIETSNGIIRALLQVYNQDGTRVLETEREGGLNTVNKTHTKTLYSVAELKAKATESTEPSTVSSGSSFKGTAFTKQCFRSSAGKLTFGFSPLAVSSGTTSGTKTASLTLPSNLGAQKVIISGSKGANTNVKRNGTIISGSLPQTIDYVAGDVYTVEATRSSSSYTEYMYYWIKFKATDYGDGNLMWAIQDEGYTGWGRKRSTAGAGTPSYEGQVKTIYYDEQTRTQTDYFSNSINLTLTYESAASYPAGFVFITSGGSYLSLPYTSGYLIESSFSIVLNGWSSASNKKYISGSDIIADYNALTANVFYPAKTTNSAVTSYKEPGKTNAPLSSIDTVIRTASSLTFSKGVESRAIVSFEGNGKSGGVYEEFKAHVETIGTTAAVHTANLKPVNSSTNIGESGNKYNAGHFNNLYGKLTGQVNDAGTSNKVYGAVFN